MAAATAGSYAASGAQAAGRGLIAISTAIQHNPSLVKVCCCFIGLALSVCSWLSILNVIGNTDWKPREILQSVFVSMFGIIIVLCDMKSEWANMACGAQKMIFKYCYFLATQTGRAFFYFYVGSITLFMLPQNPGWDVVYVCFGGTLCFLGLIMLSLRFCPCCRTAEESPSPG
eukprot:TRINITY_DN63889_c0_g1_i1.p2 TRINITY_DN63889_c0_g1~~TRINITY_DN63889_c0_g1_i1.p2  ORF type:complete len:198 (+),score=23.55 TRINITY_DN63889_c0_g1_i1:77-595(+)